MSKLAPARSRLLDRDQAFTRDPLDALYVWRSWKKRECPRAS